MKIASTSQEQVFTDGFLNIYKSVTNVLDKGTNMSLKDDLRKKARNLGADLFGVASAAELGDAPKGHNPIDVLPDAKSIIVLAMKMLDAQTDILPVAFEKSSYEISPRQEMFQGHSGFISEELDRVGYSLARYLETKEFRAYHQMASKGGVDQRYLVGLLSLKHLAVRAGLGHIGRNSLLITPQYGPRVRLTALVTDAEILPDKILEIDFCKNCDSPCISSCPVGALKKPVNNERYSINKFACSQYLNTRPTCGICLKICPVGNKRVR